MKLPWKKCACGCGKQFRPKPGRRMRMYFNTACRNRVMSRRYRERYHNMVKGAGMGEVA